MALKYIVFEMPAAAAILPLTEEALADPLVVEIVIERTKADFLEACTARIQMKVLDHHEAGFAFTPEDE